MFMQDFEKFVPENIILNIMGCR